MKQRKCLRGPGSFQFCPFGLLRSELRSLFFWLNRGFSCPPRTTSMSLDKALPTFGSTGSGPKWPHPPTLRVRTGYSTEISHVTWEKSPHWFFITCVGVVLGTVLTTPDPCLRPTNLRTAHSRTTVRFLQRDSWPSLQRVSDSLPDTESRTPLTGVKEMRTPKVPEVHTESLRGETTENWFLVKEDFEWETLSFFYGK